ncbi:HAMP domain-containing sensor histidine kinase [Rhizobacter sp. OV335]|uniref:sensor histidine kinase n=1 Tax=Rhizobacter sp. OV335 TaxID=1500264 RepID=UPI000918F8D5|nr:ATP-binding protein [Rhizobacter sp. OV335]SHM01280.1 two-component system, OmpR family, sensor histidine kinase QseC [Rhizobacter sp. OV335]
MMRRLTTPSITRRLMVALLGAYVLAWGAMVVLAVATASVEFDKEMRSVSEVVEQVLTDAALPPDAALHGVALKIAADGQRVGAERGYLAFRVHDAAGRLLAQGGSDVPALADDGRLGFFMVGEGQAAQHVYRRWTADRARRIDVQQSVAARDRVLGVGLSSAVTVAQLLIGFPVLLLPVWLAVRTGLRPLLSLSQDLAARSPADLQPVRVAQPYRELRPVVDELNGTLARLQALLQRERAFLADAAHELRTPLAVIAAQCDTLKRSRDADERDAAAQRLERGLARSMRLVNQLLALARLEAGVEHRMERIDLADVARDCLAMHADEAQARGIELGYAGPDSLPIDSPGHAVETVLHNLIGNAIRYGRPEGRVEVSLMLRDDGDCVLDVSDDGPGIAVADRAHVFERFRRGTASAAAASGSGSGLGLAIVQAATQQMGALIELKDGLRDGTGGPGLSVTLRWRAMPVAG